MNIAKKIKMIYHDKIEKINSNNGHGYIHNPKYYYKNIYSSHVSYKDGRYTLDEFIENKSQLE